MAVQASEPGFFGKLPDRGDYVTGSCPPGFLRLWESFVTTGMARARQVLDDRWNEAYMTMPIWRFSLEPDGAASELSASVFGVFMPSVDRVGRAFPLTVVASKGNVAMVDSKPLDQWYADAEQTLLQVLGDDARFEDFRAAVSRLGVPFDHDKASETDAFVALQGGPGTTADIDAKFWCRAGDRQFGFKCRGMPEADTFRWFLLPELYDATIGTVAREDDREELAGQNHPEDHQI